MLEYFPHIAEPGLLVRLSIEQAKDFSARLARVAAECERESEKCFVDVRLRLELEKSQ
jgi:hypothetical protein